MSGADKNGAFAIGSDGVASRSSHGPIYIQETFFPPDQLPSPLATTQNGRLLSARPYGTHLRRVANIAAFEQAHDPDGLGVDSDPYAVLARRDGSLLVADAAANDVLSVDRWGHIRVFHVFPNVTTGACASHSDPDPSHPGCNYVPTSLATDRFGHVYVGGLSSLTPNEARVTELSANGRHVLHVWTGFTAVTGVAVARNGTLYVSQLMAPEANPPAAEVTGVLTRVHHGQRTDLDVPFPAGLALDRHGRLYVAAWSVAPESGLAGPGTSGQVWRLRF
jgi:sugar lactone lactonase YvrE